jgi:hypothetical protein
MLFAWIRKTKATLRVAFLPIGEVHTLRKFLAIIGGLFLILVLVVAGFVGYAALSLSETQSG